MLMWGIWILMGIVMIGMFIFIGLIVIGICSVMVKGIVKSVVVKVEVYEMVNFEIYEI